MNNSNPSQSPTSIKIAAGLFVVSGLLVLVNALVYGSQTGWEDPRGLVRALIRPIGTAAIAWYLLNRARWAWWVSLGLGGFWLLGGLAGIAIGLSGAQVPLPAVLFILVPTLGAAIVLLLLPTSRAWFRA